MKLKLWSKDKDKLTSEKTTLEEVFLPQGDILLDDSSDDGLIWKTILKTGNWKLSPGPNGKAIDRPLKIVKDTAGAGEIALADIKQAFDDGAVENVTVPLSHADTVTENTGFIKQLKLLEGKDGQWRLAGAHEFTDATIAEKVKSKSIVGNSVGLVPNFRRKSDGKAYPVAMIHSALTNRPWIDGMEPFGINASEVDEIVHLSPEEEIEEVREVNTIPDKISVFRELLNDFENTYKNGNGAANDEVKQMFSDVTQKFDTFSSTIIEKLSEREASSESPVRPSSVAKRPTSPSLKVTPEHRLRESQEKRVLLSQEFTNNTNTRGGKRMSEDATALETLELSDEARQHVNALVEQTKKDKDELANLRKDQREKKIDDRVEELKKIGLDQHPGFLKQVRNIYLSDDGEPAILLSQDGSKTSLTASQIADSLIDAFPKDDEGKIKLSDQARHVEGAVKPPVNTDEEIPLEDRTKAAKKFLYGNEE